MQRHTQTHISYARGYGELGLFKDALKELDKIDPAERDHKSARVCRLVICTSMEDWSAVVEAAKGLAHEFPEESEWGIQWAYGARRAESLGMARRILLDALERFPEEPCIQYNLGCYDCIDGNLHDAKGRVRSAIELDRSYLQLARRDTDLNGIQEWLKNEYGQWEG